MRTSELAAILKQLYDEAKGSGQATAIHLFGVRYADHLAGRSLKEIAETATGKSSYQVEIRKGMNLATHVISR